MVIIVIFEPKLSIIVPIKYYLRQCPQYSCNWPTVLLFCISDNEKCAFFAGLKSDKNNLPSNAVIVFDYVKLNVGGCYSGSSGKFTAMEDGLYVFSWTTLSNNGEDFTSVIVKDGVSIAENVVDSDSVMP